MLTDAEKDLVRRAVGEAEAGLSAEIVPCVYEESGPYPEAPWKAAAAAAAFAFAALPALPPGSRPAALLAAGAAGAALGRFWAPARRFVLGRERLERAAALRAREVFFDRGVSATASRGGVLVFASLLERRVVVLADRAVAAMGPDASWEPVVSSMTGLAAAGRVGEGLAAAVRAAADVLRAAGFSGKGGGELGDEPLTGGR